MKAKGLFRLALACIAAAGLVCGCRERRAAANPVVVARQTPPSRPIFTSMAGSQWEYRTVNADAADLRQRMGEWASQGWAVISISRPIPGAGGTLHQEVRLRRAANGARFVDAPRQLQPGFRPSADTQWEFRTIEQEMTQMDLRQDMRQWNFEGWSVVSVSGPIPQDDGTIKCQVKLKRPR